MEDGESKTEPPFHMFRIALPTADSVSLKSARSEVNVAYLDLPSCRLEITEARSRSLLDGCDGDRCADIG